ncbi:hypothetical protein pipiens_018822 [Culex pipiens pipiens]|uniref:ZAD domain-containing protein n=1 Tax=Culex pipiens pipiens TaxID=38569 RepID=A0ABD1DXT8_CULPP
MPPPMENLCRICARSEEDRHAPLVCVFGTTIELDQRHKSGGGGILVQTVAQAMASCLEVEIKHSDQLPQRICAECLAKLRESWALKEMCKVSEKQLRRMLNEATSEKVKREDPVEDDDFGQDVCFVEDDEYEDEKVLEELVELLSPPRRINPEDPLHSELGWHMSDLVKGKFRTRPGDAANWDRVEVEDFRCCGCYKFFDSKAEMVKHCKQNHKEEPAGRNKRYECCVCLKLFASTDALSFHEKLARSRMLFHCKQCDVLSPSKRQLMAHLKLHAQGKLDMAPETVASPVKKEERPLSVTNKPEKSSLVEPKTVATFEPPPAKKCREVKNFVTFDYYAFDGFCCCDCWTYCETKREMKRHGEKEHFGNRGFEEDQTCFACWSSINRPAGLHEGFIELEMIDIKEEVEAEPPVGAEEGFCGTEWAKVGNAAEKDKRDDKDMVGVGGGDFEQDAVGVCGYYRTFITEEELADLAQEHCRCRSAGDKQLPYECERGCRRFNLGTALTIHQQFARTVREYATRRGPFTENNKFHCCFTLCKQAYDEYGDLLCHVDEVHGLKRNQFKDYRDTDENCCEICFRSFNNYGACCIRLPTGSARPMAATFFRLPKTKSSKRDSVTTRTNAHLDARFPYRYEAMSEDVQLSEN